MTYGIIMAGGKGTRLWPEGRQGKPKQLLALVDNRTMIETAVNRLAPLIPQETQLVITTREYAGQIADALPGFPRGNILAEPEGKDTAPCFGWAALKVLQRDPEAVMAVVAADHVVADEPQFLRVIKSAVVMAKTEPVVVTVGLAPTRPDTGLGYIRLSHQMTEIEGVQVYRADRFVEKPSEEKAREYLEDGRYLWNSGMFIVQANHALKLFARHLPSHYALLIEIQNSLGTPHERQTTEDAYGRFERISIDFGIMEHANDVAVIRGDFGWLDVGTWPSLDLVSKHDARGNIVRGNHVGIGTERCIIRSGGTLVATLGVHDLVVIETPDAVLVCSKSHAQDVRDVVQRLQESGRSSAL